ncbi:MAG: sugar phosphate isomerase/epimerase family protein [Phascolarctobacterium sp.]|nr:sugar phosphate isomerase/epimerase family protein [Phascolarctobacterium sp.]MEE1230672.1 sugar phosphate isomerase/epimerase family protein [Phascolarctobacterium sp.]
MQFEISDLLFAGFPKFALRELDKEYGIEFFYEFGKDYYWDNEVAAWGKRSLSIHGPCVAVNLADKKCKNYAKIFAKTFAYAKEIKAGFVVVHTNEAWQGEREQVQNLVIRRLRNIIEIAEQYNVKVLIENVGLRPKQSLLFDLPDFMALLEVFTEVGVLLDTGHAHVNGWDIPAVIKALGKRLKACHLHDNGGAGDEHLPIGQGSINWEAYFKAIQKHAPKSIQVLEYCRGFESAAGLEQHIEELKVKYKL